MEAINPEKALLADFEFLNAGKILFGENLPSLAAKQVVSESRQNFGKAPIQRKAPPAYREQSRGSDEHFQMENLLCAKLILNPRDFMVKVDLKNA